MLKISSTFSGRERTIDFVLARRATLREVQRGILPKSDVCDAQPELMRAAKHVGSKKDLPCPICSSETLVSVLYAFGAKLPAHGRCITNLREVETLVSAGVPASIYQVEVCTECRWNHLERVITQLGDDEKTA